MREVEHASQQPTSPSVTFTRNPSAGGNGATPLNWTFDANGHDFQMALEARRIRSANVLDHYTAIHSSQIEPLPHQISAVYHEMLERNPLRFLLADDPGAGKTIMAGLLLKELIIRGDVKRCLIVVPGNLVEQWRIELSLKFGLEFSVFGGARQSSNSENPFVRYSMVLARMDTLSRSDEYRQALKEAPAWDLVICDEAHRMAASLYGTNVHKTRRYRLGELLGSRCKHFLLMTATPHNGKEADFQLFMALLDKDRFPPLHSNRSQPVDIDDLMRRLTKEELLRFDGTPLFPERKAYTAQFRLSRAETELYEAVTAYVRDEMNRVERFTNATDRRRQTVGFALLTLQRRLASSPAAIHSSLRRRRERLQDRQHQVQDNLVSDTYWANVHGAYRFTPEWLDDAPDSEVEDVETQVLDNATAASTAAELRTEIETLSRLEGMARRILESGNDTKWLQLNSIFDDPLVSEAGKSRKLIVFTEARDTLTYLAGRIRTRLGRQEAVVEIHGGLTHRERQHAVERFSQDDDVQVLVANDAAGEGVNLQCAHLMVNYDLPWNPNRLEQRFGRIHRIGQTEVCHLWNLVAKGTREGDVFARLLEKLDQAREALGGRVYDVMGQLFEARPLRSLMVEAIRYGDRKREGLLDSVGEAADTSRLRTLLEDQALSRDSLGADQAQAMARELQQAEAVRLQPFNIREFFLNAFERLGGRLHAREKGRWQITHVPQSIRRHGPHPSEISAISRQYERVCFDKKYLTGVDSVTLLCPGHPLFDATINEVLERYQGQMRKGAVLVDPAADARDDPIRVIYFLSHAVLDGQYHLLSQRIHFVEVTRDGTCQDMGPSPILDLRPIQSDELELVGKALEDDWHDLNLEPSVLAYARTYIAERHVREIRSRHGDRLDMVKEAIGKQLTRAINYWDLQAEEAKFKERAGKKPRIASGEARARAESLAARRTRRIAEISAQQDITAHDPSIVSCALIVPQGLLDARAAPLAPPDTAAESRAVVEQLAMQAVMAAERSLGYQPSDVSAEKLGYDVRSCPGQASAQRFIEVKGRTFDARDVTVTANEIRTALNKPNEFILAVVRVKDGESQTPQYVRRPFVNTPDPAVQSARFSLNELLRHSTPPC